MPISITLSNLCWSPPDGTPLLHNLNLSFGPGRTGLVGRNGVGKTALLRLIAGEIYPQSGNVHVDGTLAWMRQDMLSAPQDTIADLFGVVPALALLGRAVAGRAGLDEVAEVDWALPSRIEAALLRFGLDVDPHVPLASLSGGQRTRASLAALVFSKADFLLLDEPTNNLDREGRRAVFDLLGGWKAGAIVVSHDRELLNEMDAIVQLTTLGATKYGGNYSTYQARKALDLHAAERELADARKRATDAHRRERQAAERKARKDSAGYKSRAKRDQPKVLLDAARGRAEASGGANTRLREARRLETETAVVTARDRVEILQPHQMEIASTHLHAAKVVVQVSQLTGGHDPGRPVIRHLSFSIVGPERVAITGPNGSGKTTLLSLITGQLMPQSGKADVNVPFAFLDQEVTLLPPEKSLRENFIGLNEMADENQCRAALARFGFRAEDAFKHVGILSGGQKLRAGLACTLGQPVPPRLLILDEPTNHIDLETTQALEASLAAYDGALLVISHDEAFLQNLGLDRILDMTEMPDHDVAEIPPPNGPRA